MAAKQSKNFREQKLTIGLDLGDRWSWYCVLDEEGDVLLEQKLGTWPGFGRRECPGAREAASRSMAGTVQCVCLFWAGTMAGMRIQLWLKVGWSLWVLAWVPFYWHQYGLQNFLYFCDLGNFFIAAALWLESPLLFSWQASGLLLFQSLYTVDVIGAILSGTHFIGGTEYMFDPHLPLLVRLLGLFHVVMRRCCCGLFGVWVMTRVVGNIKRLLPGLWFRSIISGVLSTM